ncbi:SDR family NAD(P)-dependent oxidoreductase [Mycolicibacter sinensis]|uniref:Short-chain dehydrogenase n=1 Tax=Mycolicibacter sinensis (strain JDM601) TaxID=875328 RepID=A0A1A2EPR3_MYCSD|nr:SDR family NAD(P)-dependent oxidoreductase [Mycolicibacter sinensis]OBG05126.1 short-chain dehydrogenase [Mycolicibacter sinensis]OBG06529.1 short-chain dehydrogenase [Mycolicibacter sinensis]
MGSRDKWTAEDVPDQTGRVAVITGSNTGIGFHTALVLAEHGAAVVLAVRDLDKGRAAAESITKACPQAAVEVQELDLSSLASVREAADALGAAHSRIDLLINNAGVMYTPKQTTVDGFELQFGTNHLGHFALTGLLLPRMMRVKGSRVVTVSSMAHRIMAAIHFDDLQWVHGYNRIAAYGQSKLANLMFTFELQRRLAAKRKSTIAVAAHPGTANTELTRYLPPFLRPADRLLLPLVVQSAAMGALPTLRAATDTKVAGGQYYGPGGLGEQRGHPKLVDASKQARDVELQQRLWAVSQELTGIDFPV